jgi:hypothetical protein
MRLFLASLIFLATVLDMNFGSGGTQALSIAALSAALLLAITVVLDFVWFDPPHWRQPRASAERDPR